MIIRSVFIFDQGDKQTLASLVNEVNAFCKKNAQFYFFAKAKDVQIFPPVKGNKVFRIVVPFHADFHRAASHIPRFELTKEFQVVVRDERV